MAAEFATSASAYMDWKMTVVVLQIAITVLKDQYLTAMYVGYAPNT